MTRYIRGNQDIDTSLLTLEMTWKGMRDARIRDQVGVLMPASFLEVIRGSTINFYLDADVAHDFIARCADTILTQPDLLVGLERKTREIASQIMAYARELYPHILQMPVADLAAVVRKIYTLQSDIVVYGTVVAFADIGGALTNNMVEIVARRNGLSHPLHSYTNVLGTPPEKSLTEQAYETIRASHHPPTALAKEYFWLDQGYVGRGLTEAQVTTIQRSTAPGAPELDRALALTELNLSPEEARAFAVSRTVIATKALRIDARQYLNVIVNIIIDRVATLFGTEPQLLEATTAPEFMNLLSHNQVSLSLRDRWERSVILPLGDASYDIRSGSAAQMFVSECLMPEVVVDTVEIKGQVAQSGKVRGRVKLVFGPQHNKKVEDGDIIVSIATSPQLLPAMHRAAAFVTDVGGITSHAAIVSRELKKPCIVGTKFATQVLKDGDLVEVDAEKGIVRVLKKV